MKKRLWPFFRNFEYDKPQGKINKGPQGILAISVEVIRSIL